MKSVLAYKRFITTLARSLSSSSSKMSSEIALRKGQACPPLKPGTLRLYSMRFCPYAQRTRLVLIHKGIEHETVNVNLRNKPDWLFEMNPTGLVPVLEWDGHILYESAVCNDYLDETYPQNKLNPSDPYLRAVDRQLSESMGKKQNKLNLSNPYLLAVDRHFSESLGKKQNKLNLSDPYLRAVDRQLSECMGKLISSFYDVSGTQGQDKKVMDRLFRAFQRYENELTRRGGGYFGGNKLCMVDFMIWPWFERIPVVNAIVPETTITSANYPKLAAWIDNMYQVPAVKETMFGPEPHAHFLKTLRVDKNADYDYGLVETAKL